MAGAERPKARGEKAGKKENAGKPDSKCDDYDTSAPNPPVELVMREGLPAADVQSYIDNLCFAVDDAQIAREFDHWIPLWNIPIWIQPEMRMHETDPTVDRGWGMIVAKVRNEKKPWDLRKPRYWKEEHDRKQDALLWYGVDNEGEPYAVLFYLKGGRVREISRGKWQPDTKEPKHTIASAKWNPPHQHRLVGTESADKRMTHHNGSGWISCSLGCCTAVGVNGEEPTDDGKRR
jgi:hypothetical protein